MSRIVTNSSALTVYKNYNQNNQALASSLEKLSSGLAINRASDDPSGLAISEDMRLEIGGTNEAIDNISNANNFINTADGYLQTVNDMLGRMEELAVEYGQGTNSTGDTTDLTDEYTSLVNQIKTYDTAQFNGTDLFTGNALTFQVGADSGQTFSLAGTGTMTTMIAHVTGIGDITNIKAEQDAVAALRAGLGAGQSQLNYTSVAEQNYSQNISASESSIRDVDVAQQSTVYAKEQILVQSSTAMLAQANAVPQNVLTLLK